MPRTKKANLGRIWPGGTRCCLEEVVVVARNRGRVQVEAAGKPGRRASEQCASEAP